MALLSGVAGILGRFAGRLLNSSVGWATILLFGKVSGRKQTVLLIIALASLVWVVLLIGVALPDVGTTLIAFVPAPSFVSRNLIRIVMLVAAAGLPLFVGAAAVFVADATKRPRGAQLVVALLRGYPFTLVLAATIGMLGAVALVRKVQALAHRWEDAHVALIVKPGKYDEVTRQLEDVLRGGGLDVERRPAPRVLSIPATVLAAAAGTGLGSLVPDRLVLLKAPDLEVLVHPSDLAIGGSKTNVALARALMASRLSRAPAYMTASAEAEVLEDEVRSVAEQADTTGDQVGVRSRIAALDEQLKKLLVPFEEWETVYRQRLQLERDVLARAQPPAARSPVGSLPRPNVAARVVAVGLFALTALDLAFLAADRIAPPRRPGSRRR